MLIATSKRTCLVSILLRYSVIHYYIHTKLFKMSTTFTLNTGAKIPAVGLGTWQSGQYLVTLPTTRMRGILILYQTKDKSRPQWLTR